MGPPPVQTFPLFSFWFKPCSFTIKLPLTFRFNMVPDTDVLHLIQEAQSPVTNTVLPKPIHSLKEKIKRTTQLLQELKVLSKGCQELEQNQEKDKQLFSRRTVQVGAEIQDARDLLSTICKGRLPLRQWQLLFEAEKGVMQLFYIQLAIHFRWTSHFYRRAKRNSMPV